MIFLKDKGYRRPVFSHGNERLFSEKKLFPVLNELKYINMAYESSLAFRLRRLINTIPEGQTEHTTKPVDITLLAIIAEEVPLAVVQTRKHNFFMTEVTLDKQKYCLVLRTTTFRATGIKKAIVFIRKGGLPEGELLRYQGKLFELNITMPPEFPRTWGVLASYNAAKAFGIPDSLLSMESHAHYRDDVLVELAIRYKPKDLFFVVSIKGNIIRCWEQKEYSSK